MRSSKLEELSPRGSKQRKGPSRLYLIPGQKNPTWTKKCETMKAVLRRCAEGRHQTRRGSLRPSHSQSKYSTVGVPWPFASLSKTTAFGFIQRNASRWL